MNDLLSGRSRENVNILVGLQTIWWSECQKKANAKFDMERTGRGQVERLGRKRRGQNYVDDQPSGSKRQRLSRAKYGKGNSGDLGTEYKQQAATDLKGKISDKQHSQLQRERHNDTFEDMVDALRNRTMANVEITVDIAIGLMSDHALRNIQNEGHVQRILNSLLNDAAIKSKVKMLYSAIHYKRSTGTLGLNEEAEMISKWLKMNLNVDDSKEESD